MDILYLLIPTSALLVFAILAIFGWAVHGGQFEDLDREGERIVTDNVLRLDPDQSVTPPTAEESGPTTSPAAASPREGTT